ncbi:tripartite motif-containing 59-related [Anaeramoeba flamelloides]|uniref:Tripartite motif-containing 59-related n=1 Tax=Anaeramoeba flamelloides TaxID=1746091 RepID=A0ABQ8XY84_9EUKA|nr:tripartite motif-containing 59-related [Anaeramoeba flamelloides]
MNEQKRNLPKTQEIHNSDHTNKFLEIKNKKTICEICSKQKPTFTCTKCNIYYCKNCQSQAHIPIMKKKHQQYIVALLDGNLDEHRFPSNKYECTRHKEEFNLFCQEEECLKCSKCISDCKNKNHKLDDLGLVADNFIKESEEIELYLIHQKKKIKSKRLKSTGNQEALSKEIDISIQLIEMRSTKLKNQIDIMTQNSINSLKEIKKYFNLQFLNYNKMEKEKTLQVKEKLNKLKIIPKQYSNQKQTIDIIQDWMKVKKKIVPNLNQKKKMKRNERKKKRKLKIKNSIDKFHPKLITESITISNNNQTICNSGKGFGRVCGQKKYLDGKYKIHIRIDSFPLNKNENNAICIGVIDQKNRKNFVKNGKWENSYYFKVIWDNALNSLQSLKRKCESTFVQHQYATPIKKGDILTIILDMNKYQVSFVINDQNFGVAWKKISKNVSFFVDLPWLTNNVKNQITLLSIQKIIQKRKKKF